MARQDPSYLASTAIHTGCKMRGFSRRNFHELPQQIKGERMLPVFYKNNGHQNAVRKSPQGGSFINKENAA
jgi:hypothetical protein